LRFLGIDTTYWEIRINAYTAKIAREKSRTNLLDLRTSNNLFLDSISCNKGDIEKRCRRK